MNYNSYVIQFAARNLKKGVFISLKHYRKLLYLKYGYSWFIHLIFFFYSVQLAEYFSIDMLLCIRKNKGKTFI